MARSLPYIVFALLFSAQAFAVQLDAFEARGVAFVALSGEIVQNDSDKAIASLLAALQKHKSDKKIVGLSLNSHGGLVLEAVKIGEFVEAAKIPVIVTERSSCESACFFIFMRAPTKLIAHGARIGVHSTSLNGKEDANTSLTTVAIARLAREAGVPQSVIGKMVTAEPREISYLSDNELKQMGAVFLDDDDSRLPNMPPASSQPPQTGGSSPPSGAVTGMPPAVLAPESDAAEQRRLAGIKAEQDDNFRRYWSQIVDWSKAQHGGAVAAERRCKKTDCVTIVAYFDRQQRYVEAWRYDEPPKGSGGKLVCRQLPDSPARLSCKDWYDEHEFTISATHQIGADRVSSGNELLDIFK
jgi:hypothetical protein